MAVKLRKKPFISVIITTYKRKQYLLEAFNSAINQTFDKRNYEIIVSKGFVDKRLEEYVLENGALPIFFKDKKLGFQMVDAAKRAHGEILCFLDDDDLFTPNKLQKVYDIFMHNKTIGYVNNARFYFCDDENLKKIPKDFSYDYLLLNNDKSVKNALKIADTCDSCIAIRKEILLKNAECIKNLNVYAVDSALYLFALDSNFALYNSKLKLTKYRIHESTSHQLANNSKELWFSISKHMAFVRRQLKELTLIHRCLVTDPSKKLAELKIAFAKMVLSFYSGNRLAFIKDLMAYTRLLKKEGLSIDKRLYLLLFAYVIWPALTIEMYYSASYRI